MNKPTYAELEKRIKKLEKAAAEYEKTEKLLTKKERYFHSLLFNIHEDIIVIDREYKITDINNTLMVSTGLSRDDIIGNYCYKISHGYDKPCDRHNEQCVLKNVFETGEPNQYIHMHKRSDGTQSSVDILMSPLKDEKGTVTHVIESIRDITDLMRSQEALQKSEERYKDLVNKTGIAISIEDTEGKFVFANELYAGLLGYTVDEMENLSIKDVVHPDDYDMVIENHKQRVKGKHISRYEFRGIRKDGSIIHFEIESSVVKENGKVTGTRTYFWDITERKKTEEALLQNQLAIESSEDLIAVVNRRYEYILANKAFLKYHGLNYDQVIGHHVAEIVGEKAFRETIKPHIDQSLKGNQVHYEMARSYPEIGERILIISYSPLRSGGKKVMGVVAVIKDITEHTKTEKERKKLEEQLFHAQKMESVGRLAGGIAHDFNNILTGIMGYAELLKLQFDDPSTLEGEAADVILGNAERAASLTKQLLGFARGGKYNPVPLKVNNIIKDTIKVSEKMFEKNINVIYSFEKDIYSVEADRSQLDQVITNLIINAKDAMPKGGKLIFKTENVFLDEEDVQEFPELVQGYYVKITVTDTGTGITKDIIDHIFEPFFTTKGENVGTGLGLATVYGIIKNHGGQITVASEPGEGTTFAIYLPASKKEIVRRKKTRKFVIGDATVLVIDDEENVRKLAEKQLESIGYGVLSAKNGKEAIKLYKQRKDEIDLVLLDMIMPELAGRETFQELQKINPHIKVLLVSGFSRDGRAVEILDDGVLGFVQKPFKLHELSEIMAKALEKT